MRRCRGWMIAGGSIEILKNRIAEGSVRADVLAAAAESLKTLLATEDTERTEKFNTGLLFRCSL